MDETKRNKLWQEYIKNQSEQLREQIIIEYVPLVKLVAGRLNMYLGYTVEYDDLPSCFFIFSSALECNWEIRDSETSRTLATSFRVRSS